MASRVFTYEELEELDVEFENRLKVPAYENRWTRTFNVVFECDGKFYVVKVREGLTEEQEVYGNEAFPELKHGPDGWTASLPEVELYQKQVWVTDWRKI